MLINHARQSIGMKPPLKAGSIIKFKTAPDRAEYSATVVEVGGCTAKVRLNLPVKVLHIRIFFSMITHIDGEKWAS